MITLSRLNGHTVAINPDLITWIDVTPDTTVSLLTKDIIIVREPLDEVIARIIEYRKATGGAVLGLGPRAMEQLHTQHDTAANTRSVSRLTGARTNPPPRSTPPRGNPSDRT